MQLITDQTFNELKATHKGLQLAEITSGTEGEQPLRAVFRDPTFATLQAAKDLTDKGKDMDAALVLYQNCVLAADAAIQESDVLKLQVVAAINHRIGSLKAHSKNL